MKYKHEYKEFVNTEMHIHLDKAAGKKNSTTLIDASKVGLMTMLTSFINILLEKNILCRKDLIQIIALAEIGVDKNESK